MSGERTEGAAQGEPSASTGSPGRAADGRDSGHDFAGPVENSHERAARRAT